jgi:hypothetical protein
MNSWKTTQFEQFVGNVEGGYFKYDLFFITYKKYGVCYEMSFKHNLN